MAYFSTLPGLPKELKWPVELVDEAGDYVYVFCHCDSALYIVRRARLTTFPDQDMYDKGLVLLKKKPNLLKAFKDDIEWASKLACDAHSRLNHQNVTESGDNKNNHQSGHDLKEDISDKSREINQTNEHQDIDNVAVSLIVHPQNGSESGSEGRDLLCHNVTKFGGSNDHQSGNDSKEVLSVKCRKMNKQIEHQDTEHQHTDNVAVSSVVQPQNGSESEWEECDGATYRIYLSEYEDDDVKDPNFVLSDTESSSNSSLFPQFEEPDISDLEISPDLTQIPLAVEEECFDSRKSDNENQESHLNPEWKSIDMILEDKGEVSQDCCVSSSEWCAHSRDLNEDDKVFCEKNPSIYIKKMTEGNSKSKTGRCYDIVHSCYFCGRLMTHIQSHLINTHKNEDRVQDIVRLQEEIKAVSSDDGKRGLKEQMKMKQTLLRNEGDHKHNYHVLMKNEGELLLTRRRKGIFNSEDYGPCPECMEWMVLKDSYIKHRPNCPKNTQCSTSIAIVQWYIYKGKITENVSDQMKSEVFPSMTEDKLTDIAINDKLIVVIGEWHFINNMGNKIKQRSYSSYRMRLCARLLQIVRRELNDLNLTMSQCLVRENFDLFAKAALLACGKNTDDELKHPSVALKMGYDLARLVAAKMTFYSKKRDEVNREEAKQFCYFLQTDWKIKVRHQARILVEERAFNKHLEFPDPQDVAELAKHLVHSLQKLDLITDPCTFRRSVVLTEARLMLYNRLQPEELEALSIESYKRILSLRETDSSLHKELTELEKHLLESRELVEIREKTGKRVPLLLLAEVGRHLQYLTDTSVRSAVGISDENNYVFASSDFHGVAEPQDKHTQTVEDMELDEEISVLDDGTDEPDEVLGRCVTVLGRCGKKKTKPVTRQKWTLDEENEIGQYFKEFFLGRKTCPRMKDCLHAISLSKANGGKLAQRHWATIKKKVNHMAENRTKKSSV